MNEIVKKLSDELGFIVETDGRDFRVHYTTTRCHPDPITCLWRKCCELMRERHELDRQLTACIWAGCCSSYNRSTGEAKAINVMVNELESRAIALGYTKDQRNALFGER